MKLVIVGRHPGGAKPLAILRLNGVDLLLSAGDADIRRERGPYLRPARGLRTTP